jgi:hypothetical protein
MLDALRKLSILEVCLTKFGFDPGELGIFRRLFQQERDRICNFSLMPESLRFL